MKTELELLKSEELAQITGGTLLGEIMYATGVAAKCLYHFCKTASEFQASLPANLKK